VAWNAILRRIVAANVRLYRTNVAHSVGEWRWDENRAALWRDVIPGGSASEPVGVGA
jgi:hypothetical protein